MNELVAKALGLPLTHHVFKGHNMLRISEFFAMLYKYQFRGYSQQETYNFLAHLQNEHAGVLVHCAEYGRSPGALLNGFKSEKLSFETKSRLLELLGPLFYILAPQFEEPLFYQEFRVFPRFTRYRVILPDYSGGWNGQSVAFDGTHVPTCIYTRKILFAEGQREVLRCECGDCIAECCRALDRVYARYQSPTFDVIYYQLLYERSCACVLRGLLVRLKNYYDSHYCTFSDKEALKQAFVVDLHPYTLSAVAFLDKRILVESDTQRDISQYLKQPNVLDLDECEIQRLLHAKYYKIPPSVTRTWTLREDARSIISECSLNCACTCYRVVAADAQPRLCLRYNEKGIGLYAGYPICKRQYVCCYTGETLPEHAEQSVALQADALRQSYLFTISNNISENDITVDAKLVGNIARFINHSKHPNAGIVHVFIGDNSAASFGKIGVPYLAIFSNRVIRPGEEILIDYEYKETYKEVYPWSQD